MAGNGLHQRVPLALASGEMVEAIAPVVVSASRSTDIPAFFAEWFSNRLAAGYMCWTNPFNARQVQYVSFQQTRVFVFWTKNPQPLLQYLPQLDAAGVNYYFLFTVNDYEAEGLEPNVPPLSERLDTFKRLSETIGPERVIWRFDPLMLSDTLSPGVLLDRIGVLAAVLKDYTRQLIFSFANISIYRTVRHNLARQPHDYREFSPARMHAFAAGLGERNQSWGLKLSACAQSVDLDAYGIEHSRCIDDKLMLAIFKHDHKLMNFLGYQSDLFGDCRRPDLKDKGQRKECRCIVSKDIGMYSTCNHLCAYCYANSSPTAVANNIRNHDPLAERIR